MGARDIDLDSEEGWVRFRLYGAQPLDLAGLPYLMERASYKLRGIEVETTGTLVKGRQAFKVDATGEVLPVRLGDLPHTEGLVRVRAKVANWDTDKPVLEVSEITPAS